MSSELTVSCKQFLVFAIDEESRDRCRADIPQPGRNPVACKSTGYQVRAGTNATVERGRKLADAAGTEFIATVKELCRHSEADIVLFANESARIQVSELGA